MKYNPKYNSQIHSMHDIKKDNGHKELIYRTSFGSRYLLSTINEYTRKTLRHYDTDKSWYSISAFSERRRTISVYTRRCLRMCWFDYKYSQDDEDDEYEDED